MNGTTFQGGAFGIRIASINKVGKLQSIDNPSLITCLHLSW